MSSRPVNVVRDTISGPGMTGKETVGVTAAQLTLANYFELYTGVRIKAAASNTNTVYVGFNSSVTTSTGYALAAGDEVVVPVDDPRRIWTIGGAASQVFYWMAM